MNDNENVIDFPKIFPISVGDVIDGVIDDDPEAVFIISRNRDGQVNIYSNLEAEYADDLLDEGVEVYERLFEYSEEDDDRGGNIPA